MTDAVIDELVRGAVAITIVDDRAAVHAGRQRAVETHRTLWLGVRGL